MTSKAKLTQGTTLQRGDGATPTEGFTTIAEIIDFTGPNESAKAIDVSSLDSTAMEYIQGLVDGGEVTMSLNWVGTDAQQQGLRTDMHARTKRNFKITLSDTGSTATTIAISAFVVDLSIKVGTNSKIEATAKLKLTGVPTFTYAT